MGRGADTEDEAAEDAAERARAEEALRAFEEWRNAGIELVPRVSSAIWDEVMDRLTEYPEEDGTRRLDYLRKKERKVRRLVDPLIGKLWSPYPLFDQARAELASQQFKRLIGSRMAASRAKTEIAAIQDPVLRHQLTTLLEEHREKQVRKVLNSRLVSWGSPLPEKIGFRMDERIIEIPLAFEAARFEQPGKVLDAGAALNRRYLREQIGRPRAALLHFTQSADHEEPFFESDRVSYVFGDLRSMDFKDATFDRILCVSTLEHVGMDNSRYGGQKEEAHASSFTAVRELWRVLKPGGSLMLSFPYGHARDHGWYRILDESDVDRVIGECAASRFREKFYYYGEDGYWSEGTREPPPRPLDVPPSEALTGMAALLLEKASAGSPPGGGAA